VAGDQIPQPLVELDHADRLRSTVLNKHITL
jgi:hypothetical protein